jgi:hypothetical protein
VQGGLKVHLDLQLIASSPNSFYQGTIFGSKLPIEAASPGVFNPRPVDWFSATRPHGYFFRSLGAIFPIVMKMKVQKRNR